MSYLQRKINSKPTIFLLIFFQWIVQVALKTLWHMEARVIALYGLACEDLFVSRSESKTMQSLKSVVL